MYSSKRWGAAALTNKSLELAPAPHLSAEYYSMEFLEQVSLANKTTLHLGGAALFFVEVSSIEELREAIKKAKNGGLRFRVIGGGSNILVPDEGFDGLIIKNSIPGIQYEEMGEKIHATVGAGEVWDQFVEDTTMRGFYGLENLSGIPGTVGGTPIQNVGAYGVEVANLIEWVEVYDANTDSVRKMSNDKCAFGYRDSIFKGHEEGKGLCVTRVQFVLSKNKILSLEYKDIQAALQEQGIIDPTLKDIRKIILAIRSRKFPNLKEFGTAGSFFKNPFITKEQLSLVQEFYPDIPTYPGPDSLIKIPIAYVLERLPEGYKGKRFGNVGLYKNHSLVVINYGDATGDETLSFAQKIISEVKEKIQIEMEMEVQILK